MRVRRKACPDEAGAVASQRRNDVISGDDRAQTRRTPGVCWLLDGDRPARRQRHPSRDHGERRWNVLDDRTRSVVTLCDGTDRGIITASDFTPVRSALVRETVTTQAGVLVDETIHNRVSQQ
jgi:hypothetical protein